MRRARAPCVAVQGSCCLAPPRPSLESLLKSRGVAEDFFLDLLTIQEIDLAVSLLD